MTSYLLSQLSLNHKKAYIFNTISCVFVPFHPACKTDSSVFIVLKSFNLMLNEGGSHASETMYLGVTTQ